MDWLRYLVVIFLVSAVVVTIIGLVLLSVQEVMILPGEGLVISLVVLGIVILFCVYLVSRGGRQMV